MELRGSGLARPVLTGIGMAQHSQIGQLAAQLDTLIGDSDDHSASACTRKIAEFDKVLNQFGLIYPSNSEIEKYDRERRLELLGLTNEFVTADTGKASDASVATKIERR